MEIVNPEIQPDGQFLSRILDALGTSASPQDLAPVAATAVAETLGDCCALWLIDRTTGKPRLEGLHHRDAERSDCLRQLVDGWPSSHGDEVSPRALALGQPSTVEPGEGEERYRELFSSTARAALARQCGVASLLLVPLLRGSRRLGLLAVASSDPGFASNGRNKALAGEMARHITTAILQLQQIDMARQATQQLTLTSLRLQTILESIPQGVVVTDTREGRTVFANRSFHQLLGWPENATPCGPFPTPLPAITDPDGRPYPLREIPWIRSLRTGHATPAEEMVVHHPSGRKLTVLCSASPISDEHGSTVGAVALLQDISDRKEFEHQKDEFLAMVAHELRTPLTALKGYVQILLRRMSKEPEPQFGEREVGMLQIVDRQVNRFSRLIFQLLDFSRIQAGRLELTQTRFAMATLARSVVTQQQVAAPDRRLSLQEDGDTTVEGDQDRVEQVLINLISNAIKATKAGGEIALSVRREGEWVVTSVSDNGTGMPKETRAHLFERLYRGPGNSHEGMGLGLYISKGVIDAHGGKIWFESEPGKGSSFHFTLPVSR